MEIIVDIDSIKTLDDYILKVQRYAKMKTDKVFQRFIQNKVLETVRKVTNERMIFSGATVEEYKSNNKIEEFSEGFILYNDTTVDATTEGYGGKFSIALAFEYGTGIVGQENPKEKAWDYNVNQHEKGWTYYKNDAFHFTKGYQGFEIYRYTAEEVKNNLSSWVNEYFERRKW